MAEDTMGGGEDTLAGGGEDTIDGGQDTTTGGSGDDTQPGGTVLERGGEGDDTLKGGDWPDDWRDKVKSSDDDDKYLGRLKSVPDLAKSYVAAQKKIEELRASSGKIATPPKDATEEQMAEFRKEAGIPEKPEEYLASLPDGLIIGDDDKALYEKYAKGMHEQNIPAAYGPGLVNLAVQMAEDQAAQQAEADKIFEQQSIEEMRGEFGAEYKAQMNAATNFMELAPEGVKENVFGARLADGSLAGNNPDFLRWIIGLANEANPAGFVQPGDGGSQEQSISDELAEIAKYRRENRAAYYKDENMQARERQLIEAQQKLQAKTKAA